jgi:hypothetical protein
MSELGLGCVKTQAPAACVEYLGGIAYRESQILLRLDAARENSIFHTSLIFEFSHSQGQTRSFAGHRLMSGLPESGSVMRQLLANAAIAASRVGS